MLIKILIALALTAILVFASLKLLKLSRQQKSSPRNHREPILGGKNKLQEGDDVQVAPLQLEDSDAVLGIKVLGPIVAEKTQPSENQKPKTPATIVVYLMAPKGRPYIGYELLQSLLAAGLRFGEHNIFHRYEDNNPNAKALFHLASANSPGTFELSKMGSFSCPGLSLFMQLDARRDNAAIFEDMLDTINELLNELGGELWDDQRKGLSMDKITEYRLRIRSYHEANRLPDFFDQYQQA